MAQPAGAISRGADASGLYWLAPPEDWASDIAAIEKAGPGDEAWQGLVRLAGRRLDLVRMTRLDRVAQRLFAGGPLATAPRVRLAVLGASTLTHLLPGVRVAGLRRGLWIETFEGTYGQYASDLADPSPALQGFAPTVVLLALDAFHVARGVSVESSKADVEAALETLLGDLKRCWKGARALGATVVQQTILPVFSSLLGGNDHRLPGSKPRFVARANQALRDAADEAGVDLLSIDDLAAGVGVDQLHNPVMWHRAKQEVSPAAAQLYGDALVRIVAARLGRSSKCLVLDLDNTLWGGVIGDDGVEGLVLGQGSALGEAFLELQAYALSQSKRGVILAVSSKNDEANALAPFERHPEMLLKRSDIACFVANWDDKPNSLRRIAKELNIGLDSLVFVDDNPFERNLVRAELPMVAVPELPDDPALYARALADAGYFESVGLTAEDRERASQYQANAARAASEADAADLPAYLKSLGMELVWKPFDKIGLQRITQLINKTNQFNLTTRRYSEDEVLAVLNDSQAFGLQMRLIDRFGDNGIIAIVIGRKQGRDAIIDTWLMSCRVLKRQVEEATLQLVVEAARALGAARLIGEYAPTPKNGMVENHYAKLGFAALGANGDGATRWALDLDAFEPPELFMNVKRG